MGGGTCGVKGGGGGRVQANIWSKRVIVNILLGLKIQIEKPIYCRSLPIVWYLLSWFDKLKNGVTILKNTQKIVFLAGSVLHQWLFFLRCDAPASRPYVRVRTYVQCVRSSKCSSRVPLQKTESSCENKPHQTIIVNSYFNIEQRYVH